MSVVKTEDGLTRFTLSDKSDAPFPDSLKQVFESAGVVILGYVDAKQHYMRAAASEEQLDGIMTIAKEYDCTFQLVMNAQPFPETINSLEGLDL